jgi:hypothetical protein
VQWPQRRMQSAGGEQSGGMSTWRWRWAWRQKAACSRADLRKVLQLLRRPPGPPQFGKAKKQEVDQGALKPPKKNT